jgi:hypothetical protein
MVEAGASWYHLPMSWKLPENNVKNLQSFLWSICLSASQELAKVV